MKQRTNKSRRKKVGKKSGRVEIKRGNTVLVEKNGEVYLCPSLGSSLARERTEENGDKEDEEEEEEGAG